MFSKCVGIVHRCPFEGVAPRLDGFEEAARDRALVVQHEIDQGAAPRFVLGDFGLDGIGVSLLVIAHMCRHKGIGVHVRERHF